MTYLGPLEFLSLILPRGLNSSDTNITEVTSPVKLYIYNDRAPVYWTSFDDEYIILDAYNSDLENTLQASKTEVLAYKEPTFSVTDGHYPDLPSKQFPQLVAAVKAQVMATIAQEIDPKQELLVKKYQARSELEKRRTNKATYFPNYGRK